MRKGMKKHTRKDGLVEIKRVCGTDYLGRQIRKSFYGKTKRDAEEKYTQFMLSRSDPTPHKHYKFVDWIEKWLTDYKQPNVSGQTFRCTYAPIYRELSKKWNNRSLSSFEPVEMQQYFNEMSDKSNSYISKHKMFLTACFQSAVDNDLIEKSPMRGVIIPRGKMPKEKRAYTKSQYRTVLNFAKLDPDGLGPFLMLKCGFRRSELLALQWSDIDYKNKTISVNRAIKIEHGTVTVGKCKTKRSKRTIPIDDETIKYLKSVPRCSIYILGSFTDKNKPRNPDSWNHRRFAAYNCRLEKAYPDIPILNAHELRHTFGSVLYNSGVDIVTISRLMGHSKIDVTVNTYVHSNVEDLREKLNAVNV